MWDEVKLSKKETVFPRGREVCTDWGEGEQMKLITVVDPIDGHPLMLSGERVNRVA